MGNGKKIYLRLHNMVCFRHHFSTTSLILKDNKAIPVVLPAVVAYPIFYHDTANFFVSTNTVNWKKMLRYNCTCLIIYNIFSACGEILWSPFCCGQQCSHSCLASRLQFRASERNTEGICGQQVLNYYEYKYFFLNQTTFLHILYLDNPCTKCFVKDAH